MKCFLFYFDQLVKRERKYPFKINSIFYSIVVLNIQTFFEPAHQDQLLDANSNADEHYDHQILLAMNQLFNKKERQNTWRRSLMKSKQFYLSFDDHRLHMKS